MSNMFLTRRLEYYDSQNRRHSDLINSSVVEMGTKIDTLKKMRCYGFVIKKLSWVIDEYLSLFITKE